MKATELAKRLSAKKQKTISDLKKVLSTRPDENPNFCLFLGSGASRSSGILTAGELVNNWRRDVYCDLSGDSISKPDVEMIEWLSQNASEWYDSRREYSSLIEKIYPLPANRRKFIESEVADKIPSIGYAYLVRIAEAGLVRTIFTTNFDDLLNEAFYQFSSERALVCAHDSSVGTISVTSRRTKIIKLHGDYLFNDLKNSQLETQNLETNMKEKLGEFLKEYGLIIAGYSGSDKSITRPIEDMLDAGTYLQNGLFWCFRKTDEISTEALDILSKPNSFYVLTPGYDELMADLYTLVTESTPFNSKLASDRASKLLNSYLNNEQLKRSTSRIITKHLEALESDKNASLISDMMKDLNADSLASSGLSDQNLLVYLAIERSLKDRDPEAALVRLGDEIAKTDDQRFKAILLNRRFLCSTRLHRVAEARNAVKEMLLIEPANYYISLGECSLLETREERLNYLETLKARHPFSAPVLNAYATELREAAERGEKSVSRTKSEDITQLLIRSTELDPSLDNSAWTSLFSLYSKQPNSPKIKELHAAIVEKHISQDAYSHFTTGMLLRHCRKYKEDKFDGKSLFDYFRDAYTNHFPRAYPDHLEVLVEGCIEFNSISLLQKLLEEASLKEEVKNDSDFVMLMMSVYYDVLRDLSGAISFGREYLKNNRDTSVERHLLNLYLEKGNFEKARELHTGLTGAISQGQWIRLESLIFEYECKYQNAIDVIEALPDRRDFDEKHTARLAFLEIKMNLPQKAMKRCRDFLEKRSFNVQLDSEIINYEYAKKLTGGKIDLKRVSDVASASDKELVKGVCYSLLAQDEKALEIFRSESEKRFSRIFDCLRWPAISRHQTQLLEIKENLVKGKRSFTDLSKLGAPRKDGESATL